MSTEHTNEDRFKAPANVADPPAVQDMPGGPPNGKRVGDDAILDSVLPGWNGRPPSLAPTEPPAETKPARRRRPGKAPYSGWLADCAKDDRGQPLGNLANAAHALRCDPGIAQLFAFDEFRSTMMLENPVPKPAKAKHCLTTISIRARSATTT